MGYGSWGRCSKARPRAVRELRSTTEKIDFKVDGRPGLPYGFGRSYGDVCLNDGGLLLSTRGLNRLIRFDERGGTLTCEAGVSLAQALDLILPRGFFLPVTPGTRWVTIGGAIANDVHGKNHHRVGSFGRHVRRFELLRSDGSRILCSPTENADWFQATVGGLGLTGLILWVELALKRIPSLWMDFETLAFSGVREFLALSEASDASFDYAAAWMDWLAPGASFARGLITRGNHAAEGPSASFGNRREVRVAFDAPGFLLNRWTMRLFNEAYFRKNRSRRGRARYDSFFYPLDAIGDWNRLYGRRGFLQYQCVVPFQGAAESLEAIMTTTLRSGLRPFLSVLKTFGSAAPPGLLSFPRPGVTAALDFANQGAPTARLLDELDAIVRAAGGAVYPAKDARMSPESFRAYFPRWAEFSRFIDPALSSSFWRRVNGRRPT